MERLYRRSQLRLNQPLQHCASAVGAVQGPSSREVHIKQLRSHRKVTLRCLVLVAEIAEIRTITRLLTENNTKLPSAMLDIMSRVFQIVCPPLEHLSNPDEQSLKIEPECIAAAVGNEAV